MSDLLEEKGMSPADLAERMGLAPQVIIELLSDEIDAPLTEDIAQRLEGVFRLSADFWLGREEDYRESLARQAREAEHRETA